MISIVCGRSLPVLRDRHAVRVRLLHLPLVTRRVGRQHHDADVGRGVRRLLDDGREVLDRVLVQAAVHQVQVDDRNRQEVRHHLRRQPGGGRGLVAVRLERGAAHPAQARVERGVDDVHVALTLVRLLVMVQVDDALEDVLRRLRASPRPARPRGPPASVSAAAAARARKRAFRQQIPSYRIMDAPDAAEYTRVSSDLRRVVMLKRPAAVALLVFVATGVGAYTAGRA